MRGGGFVGTTVIEQIKLIVNTLTYLILQNQVQILEKLIKINLVESSQLV